MHFTMSREQASAASNNEDCWVLHKLTLKVVVFWHVVWVQQ